MVVKFGVVYDPPVPNEVVKFEFVYHVIVPVPAAFIVDGEPQVVEAPFEVGAAIGFTFTVYAVVCEAQPLEYGYVIVKYAWKAPQPQILFTLEDELNDT